MQKTSIQNSDQGFGLILLIVGVALVALLMVWQLTKTSTSPEGQPQTLLQTEQKAKQDLNTINVQLQQQKGQTELPSE